MPPLHFKGADAALEYACKYLDCALKPEASLPAVVLDARHSFGAQASVKVESDGRQSAALRVASSDGGFVVIAMTAGPKGPRLQPGQLVAWQAFRHVPEMARAAKDERFGWVGAILGTLKPELRATGWVGCERFTN